jgi:hypothetical protein
MDLSKVFDCIPHQLFKGGGEGGVKILKLEDALYFLLFDICWICSINGFAFPIPVVALIYQCVLIICM